MELKHAERKQAKIKMGLQAPSGAGKTYSALLIDVPPLIEGQEYNVTAIKMTLKMEDVFIIDGRAYYIWYFAIAV